MNFAYGILPCKYGNFTIFSLWHSDFCTFPANSGAIVAHCVPFSPQIFTWVWFKVGDLCFDLVNETASFMYADVFLSSCPSLCHEHSLVSLTPYWGSKL